ncbi:Hachiman antiphage defense system protein HamA [Methylobacterium fujisawaense]|uniref:Hachiman antiphage defense system protein HamA n=1 Tax=Methylobacterium fujisawaense TaxID=107400 RepID=UPI0031F5A5AB
MDLKTDRRMHYHGADGVYAGVTPDGILKLYWGESKLCKDMASGIRACLSSLAPFLVEPERQGAECFQATTGTDPFASRGSDPHAGFLA